MRGMAAATDALNRLQKDKLNKKPCTHDLDQLGLEPSDIHVGAEQANLINGVGDNTPMSSLYATAPNPDLVSHAASVPGTVGQNLAMPGHIAVSQLGGHNIYVNPSRIDPLNFFENKANMMHEVIHNMTGLTDADIQRALGLSQDQPSSNISRKLKQDCL